MNESFCSLLRTALAQHWVSLLIDLGLTTLLMYPLIGFLVYGWNRRWEEISNILNAECKKSYLEIFQKKSVGLKQAEEEFKTFYRKWYGPRYFTIPILLVFCVSAIENFLLAQALEDLIKPDRSTSQFGIAVAAMAGAYTFVCWDFFTRMQRRNLSRADILRSTLRLAMAIPLGFAFGALLNASLAPFIAFGIGAFPLQAIISILQRQVRKRLEEEPAPSTSRDSVVLLFGVDNDAAERIEDADITTIAQLAWCDPIQLTMRSNLQFAYVLDIMSQALAWVYFEDKLKPLRAIGLRGAVEIRTTLKTLTDNNLDQASARAARRPGDADSELILEKAAALTALETAAGIVGVEPHALICALLEIGQDPITVFLDISWHSFTSRPTI